MRMRPLLAALAITFTGCTYHVYPSGDAACLEAIPADGDRFAREYARELRRLQATPYCQRVRAQYHFTVFTPPTVVSPFLLEVRRLECQRVGVSQSDVQITANFKNPDGRPTVDPFDVLAGSNPIQPPGPTNVGYMVALDANDNEVGPHIPFPQDLTGSDTGPTVAGQIAPIRVSPTLTPPQFPIRIYATVSARQTTASGPQIISDTAGQPKGCNKVQ